MILKCYIGLVFAHCLIFHLDKLLFNSLVVASFSFGYLLYYCKNVKTSDINGDESQKALNLSLFTLDSTPKKQKTHKIITGSRVIDDELNVLIDLIIRDFIDTWYKKQISSKEDFSVDIKEMLSQVLTHLTICSKNINWEQFILNNLANNFVLHLKLFKKAKEKPNFIEAFFDLEAEFEKGVCRDEISYLSTTKEIEYLQDLCELLCFNLMREDEFNVLGYRCLVREILANKVLKDFIDNLSEPDGINQKILWLLKNQPVSIENFLQITNFNSNKDELNEIRAKINEEISLLRSKDKGGEQDQLIKLQLSSLQYLIKRINCSIKSNTSQMNDSFDEDIQINEDVSINFDTILTNEQTQNCFIEFMASQNSQNLISFYLNAQIYYKFAKKELKTPKEASKVAMQDFAKSLINLYLIQNAHDDLINISNIIFYKDELNATLERMETIALIDEFLLTELQSKVYQLMKQKYFPSFRRSNEFQKLLAKNESLKSQISVEIENTIETNSRLINEGFSLVANISSSGTCNDLKHKYAIYIIDVEKLYQETSKNEFWQTYRRFNDFHDLHLTIIKRFPHLQELKLPGKSFRSSLNEEFLEKRRNELNKYLNTLCNSNVLNTNNGLLELLLNFLENKRWDNSQTNLTRKFDSILTPVISSVKNIEASIKNAPENMANIVKDILPDTSSKPQASIKKEFMDIQKNIVDDSQNNLFLRLSLVLMDEIFDLKEKSQWFRQSLMAILKGFVRNFKGNSMNKKIKDHIADHLSEESLAKFVRQFRKRLWPKGLLADKPQPRSKSVIEITKVLTKSKLLSLVSDELRAILSGEITRQGLHNLFEMFQHKALNKRLIYVILENLLVSLFQQNIIQETHHHQLHSYLRVLLSKSARVKHEWKQNGLFESSSFQFREMTKSESFSNTSVQC